VSLATPVRVGEFTVVLVVDDVELVVLVVLDDVDTAAASTPPPRGTAPNANNVAATSHTPMATITARLELFRSMGSPQPESRDPDCRVRSMLALGLLRRSVVRDPVPIPAAGCWPGRDARHLVNNFTSER
jgi:hypothetical protein